MSSGFPNRRRSALRSRLSLERLEAREMPATLAPISDFTTHNTKALYVPLTVTNPTGTVTLNATSSNSRVQVQVLTGGTTIKLSVSGTDASNQPFQGDLTFRLFDDLAPITSARIVSLVQQGFYNNLIFHRILDGFVAQGGDPSGNGTGGSGTKFSDEFNPLLTFNSPGLLAMANSGDDTNDSQFFVTDIDLSLAQQPQNLNFNHTIFGQLVAGFDTFNKLIRTPVNSPSVGRPINPVTITNATVVANDPNGVLRVTATADFTGNSTITVTPSDGSASNVAQSFKVRYNADTVNEPAFLGTIPDQTTTIGTGVSFQLPATDLERDALTYSVISATSNGQPVNVQTRIDQATGRVTVTPPPGFVGAIDLKVSVKDATNPADTQVIKITVVGNFDLVQSSDTGTLNNDNTTGTNTPTFMILAPTGQTVTVSVNGTSAGTATETATAGQYQITLPANLLRVGNNAITGTATSGANSTTLTPLTFSYTPSLRSVYVVPGDIGSAQQVTFAYMSRESAFQDEIGYFKADDASGTIGSLRPGDAGYFAAAMARKQLVFAKGAARSSVNTLTASGGDFLVMYLVQNATSAQLLATNPTNSATGGPVAFFGLQAANPDNLAHLSIADDPAASQAIYAWEDLTGGGDRDYNDMVFSVRRAGDALSATLKVPGAPGHAITGTVKLQPAVKAATNTVSTATGEIGYFIADDATGKLGALSPGDAGYAAAALAAAQVLFASGAPVGTMTTASLTGGQSLVFYFVPGGTAAGVRSNNPTNSLTGSQVAYFSTTGANPDAAMHARLYNAEGVARSAPAANEPLTVHMMGKPNGGPGDFDDVVFTVRFGA